MMPTLHAIDLSHYNTVTSFNEVKAAGVIGVMHKATEGTSYVDSTYVGRMSAALQAGLCWGAYHFLKHGSVNAQINFFLQTAALPEGSRVAIDFEDSACTLDDLHQAVQAIEQADPTAQIAIYAGSLLKQLLGSQNDPILAPCALWLAQYTTGTPSWPTGTWQHWSLWQYTDGSSGGSPKSVNGVTGAVDCNTFNGSAEACAKWFGPTSVVPPSPPPPPAPTVATIDIVMPDGVDWVVTVNGQVLT
jgi:lysozyme